MKALQDRYNAITAGADTDIVAAAKALAELGRDIANDATIKDAKRARDKVLTDKDRVEAEATEALKVAQETPAVLKQHRILVNAVPNIGANSGKLNFMEAARYIDICEACIAIINAEAPSIAAAVALRDDVTAKRKLLDGDVKVARLVYGTTKQAEGLIKQFVNIDKAFEGAMIGKDYKVAQTFLKKLESLAKRVVELKPAMDAVEQESAARDAESDDIIAEHAKVQKIPAVTGELKRIFDIFNAKCDAYFVAYNADKFDDATGMVAEIKALRAEYLDAAADAAEELDKDKEKQAIWKADCKKRFGTMSTIRPTAPAMSAAIADAQSAFAEGNSQTTAKDFTVALASVKRLKGLLDTIDGLKKDNDTANGERNKGWKEYSKIKGLCEQALAIKPSTPEMAALYQTFTQGHDAFHKQRKEGDTSAIGKLPDLKAKAQAVVDGKDANADGLAEGRKAAEEARVDGRPAFVAALALARGRLPTSQKELDGLLATLRTYNDLLQAGRYMESIEFQNDLGVAIKVVHDAEAQWILDEEAVKTAYDSRYATVKADFDKVVAYQPVLPGLAGEIAVAEGHKLDGDTEYTSGNIAMAATHLDKLEASVAKLVAKKAAHDTAVADKTWVEAKKTSIGGDVDSACNAFALLPETQDIQGRLIFARKDADAAITKLNFAQARLQWVEIERLLGLWTAKEQDNNDAWSDEAKEVNRRINAVRTERDTVAGMAAITPELKALMSDFDKINSRFFKAYEALDWAFALELMDEYERAVKALAAAEADYDAALLLAQPIAAAATQELTAISDDDLKAKPTTEKLKLLEDMRATGEKLTPAQRKLQRKVYAALDYDPQFKKVDEERRGELVDALKADPDVTEARGKWATMDNDAKLAVLIKVMNAECKVFDIPPPAVRLFYEPPGDEGFFSGATMTLNLNTHPDSDWMDFKESVNTVVHENMHNYQEVLERRLEEGIITKDDPEYMQAVIFMSNDEPGGYVDTDEEADPDESDQDPYEHQPVEAHAWDTGDNVSSDLMAADPPDEDGEGI